MAVPAKKSETYEYAPTRVYSYSRSSVAYAAEPVEKVPERKPRQETKQETRQRVKENTQAKAKPQLKRAVLACCSVAFMAAAVLFVITRFAAVNQAYSALNDVKEDIKAAEREIEVLSVQLNNSVDIDAAREAAIKAGMGYPTAEQVVKLD